MVRITKDFLAGLLFAVFGAATVILSAGYNLGTPAQMGPGLFPMLVGTIILLCGLGVGLRALWRPGESEVVAHWEIRPLIAILAAIIAFGLLIESCGLVPALAGLVLVARLGSREGTLLELAVLLVLLIAISILIFVVGLQMPLKLFVF